MAVVEQKIDKVLEQGQYAGLALVFLIACLESLLLVLSYKTALYYLTLLVPFRVVLWSLVLRMCLRQHDTTTPALMVAGMLLPYAGVWVLAPQWLMSVELSKLSYYAGLVFSPFFLALAQIYVNTRSLVLVLEVVSLGMCLLLAVLELFFHQVLYQFWTTVVAAYFAVATELYNLSLSQADTANLVDVVSRSGTCNFFLQYFLTPVLIVFLLHAYTRRGGKVRKEWQSLTMSWTAFCVTVPFLFAGYGLLLLQKIGMAQSQSFLTLYVNNLFEVARFYPSVCGLSYVHYLIEDRFSEGYRMRRAWLALSTWFFYSFGAFFYPIFSFLGLLDRVIDLRYTRKQVS